MASMVNAGSTPVEVSETDPSDFGTTEHRPEFGSAYEAAGRVRVSNQLLTEFLGWAQLRMGATTARCAARKRNQRFSPKS
jgi:hypothetical protein